MTRIRVWAWWAVAVVGLSAGALPGCVSDEPRRPAPVASADVRPARLVLVVSAPVDIDGNGFLDTVPVNAYLFGSDPRQAVPMWFEGELEYRLTDQAGGLVAQWRFDAQQLARSRRALAFGPGYSMALRLSDAGADERTEARGVDLTATFRTPEGQAIHTIEPVTVIIGRTR